MDGGDSTGCNGRCSAAVMNAKEHSKYKAYLKRVSESGIPLYGYKMLT